MRFWHNANRPSPRASARTAKSRIQIRYGFRLLLAVLALLPCVACSVHDYYQKPTGIYDWKRQGEPDLQATVQLLCDEGTVSVKRQARFLEVATREEVEELADVYPYHLGMDILDPIALILLPGVLVDVGFYICGVPYSPNNLHPHHFPCTRIAVRAITPGISNPYMPGDPSGFETKTLGRSWQDLPESKQRQVENLADYPFDRLTVRSPLGYTLFETTGACAAPFDRVISSTLKNQDLAIESEKASSLVVVVPQEIEPQVVQASLPDPGFRSRAHASARQRLSEQGGRWPVVWAAMKPLIVSGYDEAIDIRRSLMIELMDDGRRAARSGAHERVALALETLSALEAVCAECRRADGTRSIVKDVLGSIADLHSAGALSKVVRLAETVENWRSGTLDAASRLVADAYDGMARDAIAGGRLDESLSRFRRANELSFEEWREDQIATLERQIDALEQQKRRERQLAEEMEQLEWDLADAREELERERRRAENQPERSFFAPMADVLTVVNAELERSNQETQELLRRTIAEHERRVAAAQERKAQQRREQQQRRAAAEQERQRILRELEAERALQLQELERRRRQIVAENHNPRSGVEGHGRSQPAISEGVSNLSSDVGESAQESQQPAVGIAGPTALTFHPNESTGGSFGNGSSSLTRAVVLRDARVSQFTVHYRFGMFFGEATAVAVYEWQAGADTPDDALGQVDVTLGIGAPGRAEAFWTYRMRSTDSGEKASWDFAGSPPWDDFLKTAGGSTLSAEDAKAHCKAANRVRIAAIRLAH